MGYITSCGRFALRYALVWFGTSRFCPHPSELLHWHWWNLSIESVAVKQPWRLWANGSHKFTGNYNKTSKYSDYIFITKQSKTKLCAYFMGCNVFLFPTLAIWTHQVSSVLEPSWPLCFRTYSKRQPCGINCVISITCVDIHMTRMRMQWGWLTDAMMRASSSISLVWLVELSWSSLMATGILTPSPSGAQNPWSENKGWYMGKKECWDALWHKWWDEWWNEWWDKWWRE